MEALRSKDQSAPLELHVGQGRGGAGSKEFGIGRTVGPIERAVRDHEGVTCRSRLTRDSAGRAEVNGGVRAVRSNRPGGVNPGVESARLSRGTSTREVMFPVEAPAGSTRGVSGGGAEVAEVAVSNRGGQFRSIATTAKDEG